MKSKQSGLTWTRFLMTLLVVGVLAVGLLRMFVVGSFRVPSSSMMPTIEVGDFIVVNKLAYGLRIPLLNSKVFSRGDPQRGDVVVFRFPGYVCIDDGKMVRSGDQTCADPDKSVPDDDDWVKRIIAVPGDRVEMHGDQLVINGEPVAADLVGPYPSDGKDSASALLLKFHATVWNEHLPNGAGGKTDYHIVRMSGSSTPPPLPNPAVALSMGLPPDTTGPLVVPPKCYLAIGDNRNNSVDSRWWGCLPERDLIGRVSSVWFNSHDFKRSGTPIR